MLLLNVADGPPLTYTPAAGRDAAHRIRRTRSPSPTPPCWKGRRFGNLVLAASRAPLPEQDVARAAARAPFPRVVHHGARLTELAGGAAPLTDDDPMRSPQPPDELWRVGGADGD